eukprot:scaffold10059_cov20-Tisochrysis_lutea.AAC.1
MAHQHLLPWQAPQPLLVGACTRHLCMSAGVSDMAFRSRSSAGSKPSRLLRLVVQVPETGACKWQLRCSSSSKHLQLVAQEDLELVSSSGFVWAGWQGEAVCMRACTRT